MEREGVGKGEEREGRDIVKREERRKGREGKRKKVQELCYNLINACSLPPRPLSLSPNLHLFDFFTFSCFCLRQFLLP